MDKIFLILLLIGAIISGAAAATLYKLLGHLPSPLLSLWRFQITCIAEVPIFIHEMKHNIPLYKLLFTRYLYLPILSGLVLSLYFLFFVLALELTSVAHTALICNSVPLMIVVGNYMIYRVLRKSDLIGVALGVLGLLLISLDMKSQNDTWYGDCVALAAALCSCIYWLVSNQALKHKKLPLWGFVMVANLCTGIFLMVQSGCIYEDWDVLGWVNKEYVGIVIILGICPGILTNVGYNYLMKQMRPVVVTSLANLSPFVSILIAWLAGFQGVPKITTWAGGVILITGNMIVTLAKQDESTDKAEKNSPCHHIETDLDIKSVDLFHKAALLSINHELQDEKSSLNS